MPQDPDLYGQRPQKKQKRDANLSTSLGFTAQLTSLMSNASSGASARSRPVKDRKDDIFKNTKQKRTKDSDNGTKKLNIKEVTGTEDETKELARGRRRMEEKARLYAAMKRGDYVPKEDEAAPLVDFDRKWAQGEEDKEDYSSSSDEEADGGREMVEFEDEFGRVRQVTKAEKDKLERRERRGLLGAEELERMSARPSAPTNIIYGDAIQSMAFNAEDPEKMAELAQKRDRSATPPPAQHYDADWEIRTKGTGFFKFSKDEEARRAEMESLAEERIKTEEQRRVREEQKETRRREIEKRREEMAARRAKKQADSFLDRLDGS